ncbi:MAG: xanthine dehydrogenase family protein molybdopterin-binding subunit [Gammaproteobacteria bacterium]|nr:xanthine dehydrogenase family protein molybdopterin-binding subunit [Gammaproteobacteria bacterium]
MRPRQLLGEAALLPVEAGEIALNAWLKIAADGIVTVAVPRAEMGQGVYTALPMLVAEELAAPWASLRAEQAPIASVYGNVTVMVDAAPLDEHDHGLLAGAMRWTLERVGRVLAVQVTGGSTSVRDAWLPMRSAGAAARDMLARAAAARLGVPVAEIEADAGRMVHPATRRSLAYGELAADAARLDPPDAITLRAPAAWRLLGRPLPRTDLAAKTDGSAVFGIDVRQAGTVYVSLRTAPVVGGSLAQYDRVALEARPGVIAVVPMADALAVAGRTWWHAEQALQAVPPSFDPGEHGALSSDDIFAAFGAALDAGDGSAYEDRGDALGELHDADVLRAEYRAPMLAHACMEPMNCTVRLHEGAAEIWLGNQAPDLMRRIAATALDLDEAKVRVHTPLLGGGFGRRAEPDVMLRAIEIARAIPDQAVQLVYSREEDLQHDTYRPPALARFAARLDTRGRLHAWHNHVACPSVSKAVLGRAFPGLPLAGPDKTNLEGAMFLPYAVPHRRVAHSTVPIVPPVGFWRSVGHSFNAFFTECFMDELAGAAARDPIEFRLEHLAARPRERHVLELLRDLSDWNEPPAPGTARGVALHGSFHSIVGQVAEVSIDNGEIVVQRVTCVVDCGQVVNPDIVIAQMESGIVFGLTAALYGDVRIAAGRVQQWNFPDYRMLTLGEAPPIETHVVVSGAPPGGVGEPGTPPIAPAVANALAALTGQRQRALPLRAPG